MANVAHDPGAGDLDDLGLEDDVPEPMTELSPDELAALEKQFAMEQAVTVIQSCCATVGICGGWYDLENTDDDEMVPLAVLLLEAYGQLERHPELSTLGRVKEDKAND